MAAQQYKLSKEEKVRMSNRINYFRTMPMEILKRAADLEGGTRAVDYNIVTHENKSVLVNGRIMILRTSDN